jgi:ParB family chromosome partitioning protein
MKAMSQPMSVLTSQYTVEWFTPAHALDWVRGILGSIELDPASCPAANKTVGAHVFYSVDRWDGLNTHWCAETVFLNPPFDATPAWVTKMGAEYGDGRFDRGILLVNSAPGYRWYERLWRERTVCCLEERLRFVRSDGEVVGQAKKGQTLAYFGSDDTSFMDVLAPHGRVFRP